MISLMRVAIVLVTCGVLNADDGVRTAEISHRPIVVTPGLDSIVPQVVDGAGWKTSIFVTNLDTKPINFAILFVSDTGEPLSLPVAQTGNFAGIYATLPVNGSGTIETEGTAPSLAQGYALIATFDRPATDRDAKVTLDKIGGMAIFRQRSAGRPDSEAVVPFSPLSETQMVLPFDNRSGFSTGVAIVNPDRQAAADVEFTFRLDSGAVLKQEVIRIAPGAKVTFSLPERFRETAGRNGRLNVRSSGTLLAGLGLRFNPSGAFTSSHALSLITSTAPPPPTSTSATSVQPVVSGLRDHSDLVK